MPGGSGARRANEIKSVPDTTKIRPPLIASGQPAANNSTVENNSNGTDTGIGTGTGPLNFFEPSAVSRKTHGTVDAFDINLPLTGDVGTTPGIECRTGGVSGVYQVIVAFPSPVTVTSVMVVPDPNAPGATGSLVDFTPSGSEITVNLTNVSNVQTITITLVGVNDGINTNAYDVIVPMGVLIGDTSGDGMVDSSDVSLTQSKSGQTVDASNFREDVNLNGSITRSDVSLVKSKRRTHLP